MDDSSPRSAADLVARFVETIGATDDAGFIPFFSNWAELAGTDIAAHSSPIDIRHGSLIVQVDHPGWAQRLAIRRNEIIAAIRRNHPGVTVRNIHTYVSDDVPEARPQTPVGEQPERTAAADGEDNSRAIPSERRDDPRITGGRGNVRGDTLGTGLGRTRGATGARDSDDDTTLPSDDNEFSSSLERLGRAIADSDRKRRQSS